jgi:hypothetical protein
MHIRDGEESKNTRILLGLLESVERDQAQTHRRVAADLGIALGLANAYLRHCINKGLVKVTKTPARRYAYFITPRGLAEKSRLTVKHLSYSFSFFRQARDDCGRLLHDARSRGFRRIGLAGCSDLAEIAIICTIESGVEVVAVVDPRTKKRTFVNLPIVSGYDGIRGKADAVMVTELNKPHSAYDAAVASFGSDRVLVPTLLNLFHN